MKLIFTKRPNQKAAGLNLFLSKAAKVPTPKVPTPKAPKVAAPKLAISPNEDGHTPIPNQRGLYHYEEGARPGLLGEEKHRVPGPAPTKAAPAKAAPRVKLTDRQKEQQKAKLARIKEQEKAKKKATAAKEKQEMARMAWRYLENGKAVYRGKNRTIASGSAAPRYPDGHVPNLHTHYGREEGWNGHGYWSQTGRLNEKGNLVGDKTKTAKEHLSRRLELHDEVRGAKGHGTHEKRADGRLSGSPMNDNRVLASSTGRPLYVGEVLPEQWASRCLHSVMTPRGTVDESALREYRYWYELTHDLIKRDWGNQSAIGYRIGLPLFALSQQGVGPMMGMGHALGALDEYFGLPTLPGKENHMTGYNGKNMRAFIKSVLDGDDPDAALRSVFFKDGLQSKISDFTDSFLTMPYRHIMGKNANLGLPACIDIWAARDLGFMAPALVRAMDARSKKRVLAGDVLMDAGEGSRKTYQDKLAELAKENDKRRDKAEREGKEFSPAGFNAVTSAVNARQYEYCALRYHDMAAYLNHHPELGLGEGYLPHQAQALGWCAMQWATDKAVDPLDRITGRYRASLLVPMSVTGHLSPGGVEAAWKEVTGKFPSFVNPQSHGQIHAGEEGRVAPIARGESMAFSGLGTANCTSRMARALSDKLRVPIAHVSTSVSSRGVEGWAGAPQVDATNLNALDSALRNNKEERSDEDEG